MTYANKADHPTQVFRSADPNHDPRLYRAECSGEGCGWVSEWTTEPADAEDARWDHPEVMAGDAADDFDRLVSGLLDTQDLLAALVVWLLDNWRADLPVPELLLTDGCVSVIVRCPDPEVRAEVEELVDATAGGTSLALYVEAS